MELLGNINVFTQCLGLEEGDSKILPAIVIISMDFDIGEFDQFNIKQRYYNFKKRGVDFIFEEDGFFILKSIFFHIKESEGYKRYPFLESLLIGINYHSSLQDVVNLLGKPEIRKNNWVRYKLDNEYIHFEFKNEALSMITIFI